MKRIVFALWLLLLVVPVFAQWKFGVEAGLNFSRLRPIDGLHTGNRVGWYAGPTVRRHALELPELSLGVSILYSQLAFDAEGLIVMPSEGLVSVSGRKKLPYISVPITAQYEYINGKKPGMYICSGPKFNFLLCDHVFTLAGRDFNVPSAVYYWQLGLGATFWQHLKVGAEYDVAIGSSTTRSTRVKHHYENDEEAALHRFDNIIEIFRRMHWKNNIFRVHVAYMF